MYMYMYMYIYMDMYMYMYMYIYIYGYVYVYVYGLTFYLDIAEYFNTRKKDVLFCWGSKICKQCKPVTRDVFFFINAANKQLDPTTCNWLVTGVSSFISTDVTQ